MYRLLMGQEIQLLVIYMEITARKIINQWYWVDNINTGSMLESAVNNRMHLNGTMLQFTDPLTPE